MFALRGDVQPGRHGFRQQLRVGHQAGYVTLTMAASAKYPGVAQSWVKVTGAYYGVYVTGTGCRVSRCESFNNSQRGIYVYGSSGTVENCLARGNYYGVYLGGSSATVRNCTLTGNTYGLWNSYASSMKLLNNILTADGASSYGLYFESSGYSPSTSDYNLFYLSNGAALAYLGAGRTSLNDWRTATGKDAHSLSRNPLFVNAAAGDYHEQSTAGSYHGGAFTADANDSPCLDAGDPVASVGLGSAQRRVDQSGGLWRNRTSFQNAWSSQCAVEHFHSTSKPNRDGWSQRGLWRDGKVVAHR